MCSAFLVFCVYWPGSFGKIIKNAFCSLEMACDGPFLGWAFPSRVPLNLAIGVSGLQGVGDFVSGLARREEASVDAIWALACMLLTALLCVHEYEFEKQINPSATLPLSHMPSHLSGSTNRTPRTQTQNHSLFVFHRSLLMCS